MKDEESIGYEDGQLPSKGPPAHLVKAPIRVSNHSNQLDYAHTARLRVN